MDSDAGSRSLLSRRSILTGVGISAAAAAAALAPAVVDPQEAAASTSTTSGSLSVGQSDLPSFGFVPTAGIGWRTGLNNALNGNRPAKVLCVGDSTTRGFGDSVDAKGYPADLAATLNSRGLSAARGLVIPEYHHGGQASDPRIGYPGSNWTLYSSAGAGLGWGNRNLAWSGAVGSGGMTFTPGTDCDQFDIYYMKLGSGVGSFAASVDGQAPTAVNTRAAAGVGKLTVVAANGVQANHVLTLDNVTTGTVYIIGLEAYNGTAPQVVIGNAGVSGTFSSDWAATSSMFPGLEPSALVAAYAPDLLVLMLGINDADSGIAATSYLANLQSFASRAMLGGGSVIVMSPVPSNPSYSTGNTGYESQYQAALEGALTAQNWMMIDVFNRWSGQSGWGTLDPLGWYYDDLHPSAQGYWDIAACVSTALVNF